MIIYRSFYEAIKDLPAADAAQVYNAIFDYGLNGNAQELSGIALTIFTLIKPQLDANIRKFENGTKGGRPKQKETKQEPKQNLSESKTKGNVNVNEELECKLEYKEWFDLWFAYKSEKRQTYKPIAKKQLIRSMESKYTPAQFKAAVEYSISQNYQGIFEPKQEAKPEARSPQYKKATL